MLSREEEIVPSKSPASRCMTIFLIWCLQLIPYHYEHMFSCSQSSESSSWRGSHIDFMNDNKVSKSPLSCTFIDDSLSSTMCSKTKWRRWQEYSFHIEYLICVATATEAVMHKTNNITRKPIFVSPTTNPSNPVKELCVIGYALLFTFKELFHIMEWRQ